MAGEIAALRKTVHEHLAPRTDNYTYDDDALDVAIRRALRNYTMYGPIIMGTFTVETAGYEQDLTAGAGKIENLFEVATVAYPWVEGGNFWALQCKHYTVDQAGFKIVVQKRQPISFKADELLRVRHKQLQTTKGLDEAATTSYSDQQEPYIALGAAGYILKGRVLDLAEDPSAAADASGHSTRARRLVSRRIHGDADATGSQGAL